MASAPVVGAALAEVTVVSLLYGAFFSLFCVSTFLLFRRQAQLRGSGRGGYPTIYLTVPFVGGFLLFGCITAFWVLLVYRVFQAFVWVDGGASAVNYYANASDPTSVAVAASAMASTVVGDAILIYRMSILWKHDWHLTIPPVLCVLTYIGCSVGVSYNLAHSRPSILYDWIIGTCVTSLVINIYCCALIGWKIWRNRPRNSGAQECGASMTSVFTTLIESAALLVVVTIAYVASYTAGPFPQGVLAGSAVPSAGIAFMLINMRVGLSYVRSSADAGATSSWKVADGAPEGRAYAMSPIAVDIQHEVDVEYDEEQKASDLERAPRESKGGEQRTRHQY